MGGASSKQTFTQLIHTLMEKDVGSADHEFWDELWKTVLTTEEIFEILLPDDIRKLISERPENVKTIFTQAVAQLYQVVETPYPIYFQQALNCVRVLTRLVPFLLERNDRWIKDLLWSKRFVKATPEAAAPGGEKEGQEGKEPSATENKEEQEGKDEFTESEPLAVILVNTVYHLMFLPDFTIEDPSTEFTENDIDTPAFKAALVWSDRTVTTSTAFDNHRVEILRLMLAIFCDSLYQNADTYDTCSSLWLEVATADDAPYGEIVFSSLLNCVLGYDPVGWSVPYGNLMSTDTAKLVMESSIQALLILLDYGYPIQYDPNQSTGGLPYVQLNEIESKGYNVFRRLLGSIEDPDYLNFIYQGFVRLLNNAHQSESTYLPYSIPRINIEQELLILFWKCLEEIPKFMPYILKHCDITEILVPICYFMLEGRKDPSKVGLMYLCTFTLLKLSGERNFGVALNKVYQLRLPVDVPLFSGNHSDLLIIVLHKLIVSGLDKLSALYSCFLTIICNISPYCKTLSAVSAVKLVNLMQLFVSPNFLYAAEGNHVYVGLLLETFNNIVQYQYEGNGNLVYSIIRRKDIFESLSNLTLPAAIKTASDIGQKSIQPKKEANHTNNAGNNHTTAKISKGGKLQKGSEENLEVYAEAKPTELISTQNLERKLGDEGEVIDVKTEEAESRTPNAPEKESSTILPPRPPVSEHEVVPNQLPPGRFIPTEKWLQAVKAELPLNTLMRLLKHLVPQIDELSNKTHSLEEKVVLDFLHSTTMVGLLPVPHPIVIRKYQPNKFTCLWFTAFLWGVVFMHNQTLPLYDGKNVKLFIVQSV